MAITVVSGPHILAGESLSTPINVAAGGIFRIIMPDGWTASGLTFQISYDGTYYYNVYSTDGVEVAVPVIPGGIMAFGDYLMYIQWVKFRAGTAINPVPQEEDRSFRVVLDTKSAQSFLAEGQSAEPEVQSEPAEATPKARKPRKAKAKAEAEPKPKPLTVRKRR